MLLTQPCPNLDVVPEGRVTRGFAGGVDDLTLARARRGDRGAFASLYDRFGGPCYTLALRMSGNPSAAEDIVQEVFAKVLVRLKQVRDGAVLGAWLKRICVNETIDWLRARRGPELEVDLDQMTPAADTPDPSLRHDLWGLLQTLPEIPRSVVLLHEVEGYTHGEIAKLFGMSESFSKSLLARTLNRLRASLDLRE